MGFNSGLKGLIKQNLKEMEKITQYVRPIEPAGEGDNIYLPARGKRNGKISMQHLGNHATKILKCF